VARRRSDSRNPCRAEDDARGDARGAGAADTLLLADFVNSTTEPVFDRTLKVALAVALEQSPFIRFAADPDGGERTIRRRPDPPRCQPITDRSRFRIAA